VRVSMILTDKGSNVATVSAEATLAEAAAELRLRRVGALVVASDGQHIDGIVSERDIVYRMAERGEAALHEAVSSVMSTEVMTCDPADTTEDLMRVMTDERVRHLPVVVEGVLTGLVSIGDIVKARLSELETETQVLHEYIETGR
jgi:CBS domain-containing protein